MNKNFIFNQYRSDGGCHSYLLGDLKSGFAAVIDPRVDEFSNYEELLASHRLQLKWVFESHTHADHYSGSHLLAQKHKAPVVMGGKTKSGRAKIKARDGDVFDFTKDLFFRVLETPGHTPDSICFELKLGDQKLLFTGDTLLVGGSGRVDFPEADAGALFDSLGRVKKDTEAGTWIFPAHDYTDTLFSRLDCELQKNPHLNMSNRADFVKMKQAEVLEPTYAMEQVIRFNCQELPEQMPRSGISQAPSTLCGAGVSASCMVPADAVQRFLPEEFREKMHDAKNIVIDVREPEEFGLGHFKLARNIRLGQVWSHIDEMENHSKTLLYCQTGRRSLIVSKTLFRLGMKNIADLNGGFSAAVKSGKFSDEITSA